MTAATAQLGNALIANKARRPTGSRQKAARHCATRCACRLARTMDRADPIGILRAADAARQPDLVPLRYGRMLQSPFTFYRGAAGVMAADLPRTPVSGIKVQACGDCHLMNFGGFATPERNSSSTSTTSTRHCRRPGSGTSSVSSRRSCSPPVRMGSRTQTAATRRSPALAAIRKQCATSRRWTRSMSGMPVSTTAMFWRCCRRTARRY